MLPSIILDTKSQTLLNLSFFYSSFPFQMHCESI